MENRLDVSEADQYQNIYSTCLEFYIRNSVQVPPKLERSSSAEAREFFITSNFEMVISKVLLFVLIPIWGASASPKKVPRLNKDSPDARQPRREIFLLEPYTVNMLL